MKIKLCCLVYCLLVTNALAAGSRMDPVANPVAFTGKYFLTDDLTEKPVLVHSAPPSYPSEFTRDPNGGQTEIAFIINEKGRPEEVQVATATNAAFGEAAVQAVKSWRFKPGKKEGVPVRVGTVQKIEFKRQP